jgi:hypothetical protein
MLKALPLISKKFLIVLMGVFLVVSMVFFISPGKINATVRTSGVSILSQSGGDVTVGVSAQGYNGDTYEIRLINNTNSTEIGSKITGTISADPWSASFDYSGLTSGSYVVYFTIKDGGTTLAIKWANFSIASPSSSSTPAPVVYEKTDTGFATLFYNRILGRAPDTEGLDSWVAGLTSGALTGADLINGFIFSDENKAMTTGDTNEQFITSLYRLIFDRVPDADGFKGWLDAMNAGMTKEEVVSHFASSAEFIELCNEYGITP